MIESEQKKQELKRIVHRWTRTVKVERYLRDYDVPSLVNSIMEEFYHITLCCGHKVREFDEGVSIAFKDYDDGDLVTVQGTYCRDCASMYKKKLGAWEIKNE